MRQSRSRSQSITPRFPPLLQRLGNLAKALIAATALSTATATVLADDIYPYVDFSHIQSAKSRAEVQAELANATPAETFAGKPEYVPPPRIVSGKTRAEAQAELADENSDERMARNLEYVPPPRIASAKTRTEVRTELARASARN